MGKTAVSIHVQVFGWRDVFIPLDKYLGAQLLDHTVWTCSALWESSWQSPHSGCATPRPPHLVRLGLCILAAFVASRVNLRLPDNPARGHFCPRTYCLPYVAFGEVSLKVSAQWLAG